MRTHARANKSTVAYVHVAINLNETAGRQAFQLEGSGSVLNAVTPPGDRNKTPIIATGNHPQDTHLRTTGVCGVLCQYFCKDVVGKTSEACGNSVTSSSCVDRRGDGWGTT